MRVSTAANQRKPVSGWSRKERHYVYLGLAFASPWIIGFLAFTVYPFFGSLYLSLTEYDLFTLPSGWAQNYELILADDRFYKSLGNTFFMAFISVADHAGRLTADSRDAQFQSEGDQLLPHHLLPSVRHTDRCKRSIVDMDAEPRLGLVKHGTSHPGFDRPGVAAGSPIYEAVPYPDEPMGLGCPAL
ncbi:Uncharacterised protein [Actinobacillus pleuropneumoniae]|nr:Uncharacterised protein [Actinobacillus pleuropneumoniae]